MGNCLSDTNGKSFCTSCGLEILDGYLLKVDNLYRHVHCLSCSVCNTSLGQHGSCCIKDQKIFCELDYFRKYGPRCACCGDTIRPTDWAREVKGSTFHLACFSCNTCKRHLSTEEECGLIENRVFCRPHYDIMLWKIKLAKGNVEQSKTEERGSINEDSSSGAKPAKKTRTIFTGNQRRVMQSYVAEDNNPDSQTLQELSERTGLSHKVIQSSDQMLLQAVMPDPLPVSRV